MSEENHNYFQRFMLPASLQPDGVRTVLSDEVLVLPADSKTVVIGPLRLQQNATLRLGLNATLRLD